ncbi:MAG: glucose-6-phosphate isomerase [Erysipelotrichaceae bacterium]|nr:glucose-6-phosphate isomerase [Erysipelotrichaceae bacterium]
MNKMEYRVGQVVQGIVTGIKPYGAFVKIDDRYDGMIHISEISSDFVRDVHYFVKLGEKIVVKIIDINPENNHLTLSLKAVQPSRRTRKVSFRSRWQKDEEGFAVLEEALPKWIEKENMKMKLDYSRALLNEDLKVYQDQVNQIHESIMNKTCKGNDFIGWVEWPYNYDKEEFERIKEAAAEIRENADVLLVCGIGGSYLGARSAIEMMKGLYPDDKPEIIYTGNGLSSTYLMQILKHIEGKSVYCNVISKSGTTTETAVAFRIFEQYIVERYGVEESRKRILATTDKARGTLKELADTKGYRTFVIPDDIGGRYSVFTAVGLLPIAAAGINIDELMKGCQKAYEDFRNPDLDSNIAYQYAVIRRILEKQGKSNEILVTYEPSMTMIAEWWKQLFGESEGKEGKGIYPASVTFTTDLHSMGQFIQEGKKTFYETVVTLDEPMLDMNFPADDANLDHMNYLAGKNLDWINKMACRGTVDAHVDTGNVPNVLISLKDNSAFSYGYMIYFFFRACAMTVLMLDVNPFNQPGVEVYKKNMFKLLGKI